MRGSPRRCWWAVAKYTVDTLEDMIERYGSPHLWDEYLVFVNRWRLVAETVQIRAMIDVALRCPVEALAKMARDKFGENFDVEGLDAMWPGRGDFEYDWEGVKRAHEAKFFGV